MTTITRSNATAVAEIEDARLLDLLRSLSEEEWRASTCCEGWDVRAMALHVLGAAESASKRELVHQLRVGSKVAKQLGRVQIDGVNEVQIRERSHLTTAEVLDRLADAQPRFRRARRTFPTLLRAIKVPAPPFGKISLGRLMDVVYLRDTWMHRIDICRATGRPIELTPEHDGFIVADVVDEWARTHGHPCELTLTGPAGGHWSFGGGGDHLELDAVELVLTVSGRVPGGGLLTTGVLF